MPPRQNPSTPGRPVTSANPPRWSHGGDAVGDGLLAIELSGLLERRGEPGLVVVRLPPRGEAPEDLGRADDVARRRRGARRRPGCTSRRRRSPGGAACRVRGRPREARGAAASRRRRRWSLSRYVVWSRRDAGTRSGGRSSLACTHDAARGLRLRPARGPHRPGPDRAPRTRRACSSTAAAMPPEHRHVADLPDLLREGDVVVVNESRVVPARLRLRRSTGGAAEVLLLEPVTADRTTWEALIRPARRLRAGDVLAAPDGRPLVVVGERTAAGDTFRVELCGEPDRVLDDYGEVPLPPYIRTRLDGSRALPDRVRQATRPRRRRRPPVSTSPPSSSAGSGRWGWPSCRSSWPSAWTRSSR